MNCNVNKNQISEEKDIDDDFDIEREGDECDVENAVDIFADNKYLKKLRIRHGVKYQCPAEVHADYLSIMVGKVKIKKRKTFLMDDIAFFPEEWENLLPEPNDDGSRYIK
jgi:hypothetical protein